MKSVAVVVCVSKLTRKRLFGLKWETVTESFSLIWTRSLWNWTFFCSRLQLLPEISCEFLWIDAEISRLAKTFLLVSASALILCLHSPLLYCLIYLPSRISVSSFPYPCIFIFHSLPTTNKLFYSNHNYM